MARDLSKVSNLERMEEVVAKGFRPTFITVHFENDKGELELVRVLMPKEGRTGQFSVGLLIEDTDRIGVFGAMSKSFVKQMLENLVTMLKDVK